MLDCGGDCIDPNTSVDHCGGCDAPCDASEACVDGTCRAPDCATLLANDNTLGDGLYTIDPDGAGGEAPFEVLCNMSTDGGGWIELALDDDDNLIMGQNDANNPWLKCADDSAKHFDSG